MSPDNVMILIVIATAAWVFTKILPSPIPEALARRIGVLLQERQAGELRQGGTS